MLLLLACTHSPIVVDDVPENSRDSAATDSPADPPNDSEDTTEYVTGEPETLQPAPGVAALSCAAAIPSEGKTDCTLTLTDWDGVVVWDGPAGAGLHGRSSLGFPKPQYAIELREADGSGAEADLFGMGAEDDWLLNGMYIDRALFRNKLAYDLSRAAGNPAPESVYLTLTVNGTPMGIYVIVERIDRDRLDLGEGGLLAKASESGFPSTLQYGTWELLYPTDSVAAEAAGVAIAEFEAAIWSGEELSGLLDVESFIDFILVEEMMKNNDGYYLSHHLWRGEDGLFRLLPWDLDLTLGQPNYNDNYKSDSWILYRPDLEIQVLARPPLHARLAARWAELRQGPFATEEVLGRMDAYEALLGEHIAENFQIWPIGSIQFSDNQLYPVSSPEEEFALVRAWTEARLTWMDENIGDW